MLALGTWHVGGDLAPHPQLRYTCKDRDTELGLGANPSRRATSAADEVSTSTPQGDRRVSAGTLQLKSTTANDSYLALGRFGGKSL